MVQSTNLTPTAKELAKGVNLSNDHAAETNADEVLRIRSAGCACGKGLLCGRAAP